MLFRIAVNSNTTVVTDSLGGSMKKIAVIMESWMRCFTYAWPSGMLTKIKESGADVNLYIFNSSANWSEDEKYNMGEYNIFRLPNLEEYDARLDMTAPIISVIDRLSEKIQDANRRLLSVINLRDFILLELIIIKQ